MQTPAAASKVAGRLGWLGGHAVDGHAVLGLAVVFDVDLHPAVLGRRARTAGAAEAVLDRRAAAHHEHADDRPLDRELAGVVAGPAHVPLRERVLAASVHAQLERPAGLDEVATAAPDYGALRKRPPADVAAESATRLTTRQAPIPSLQVVYPQMPQRLTPEPSDPRPR